MAHDVFISYASEDKPTADAACAVLEQSGIRCWIAPRDIVPGADWGEAIVDAIGGARALVLVFSSHANASPQIKREVERAVNKGIAIVPLRIEDVAPNKSLEYFISTPHWLDAFSPPLARHLDYLADVLKHILKGGTPSPPPRPASKRPRAGMRAAGAVTLGAVLAAGLLAALGLWYLTQPAHAPSFAGKWELQSLTLGAGSLRADGPAFATDVFAKAALEGPDVQGTFQVDDLGRYQLTLSATDRGSVVVEGDRAVFTSDITDAGSALTYRIVPPKDAPELIAGVGGRDGESALLLVAEPRTVQAMLAGTPAGQVFGAVPPIAGHWHADVRVAGRMAETSAVLDIAADGRYRFRGQTRDSGLWEAADGKWTRRPQDAPVESGTYRFDGPDRVTTAGITGTTVWRRID